MRHDEYSEMIRLSLVGELSGADEAHLQNHLKNCPGCRKEQEDWTRFYDIVPDAKKGLSEALLQQARRQLLHRIDHEPLERRDENRWFRKWLESLRKRTAIAAALVAGMLIGYFAVAGSQHSTPVDLGRLAAGELSISNVRILENPGDETIELAFDIVRPTRLSGSLDDRPIQQILTYTMVTGQNPGVRIRAAELITSHAAAHPDSEIEAAFLAALKTDDNPAVREGALRALSTRPASTRTIDGLLYVLANDVNSKLRIEAIDALEEIMHSTIALDGRIIRKLRQEIEMESNQYIRLRGHRLIEKAELAQ